MGLEGAMEDPVFAAIERHKAEQSKESCLALLFMTPTTERGVAAQRKYFTHDFGSGPICALDSFRLQVRLFS
jgi:hypothetical protein